MVDMALMTKLAQALPLESRLILLGDKDQLASVEAGAVFGDICAKINDEGYSRDFSRLIFSITGYKIPHVSHGKEVAAMRDPIIQLRKNYRFSDDSGISQVSYAVNAGDSERASRLLMSGEFEDILWRRLPSPIEIIRSLRKRITQEYGKYLRAEDLSAIFQLFESFRILCALRRGPYGSVSINIMAEQILRSEGLINIEGEWYVGRPVMITRNDYNLQLYNGDIGIALLDKETDGDLRVFFQGAEGHIRKFHPLSLPDHETVFAMTVHKSQGSEFDKILLILSDRESPILTREIIYTGITRAKKSVEIWGREDVFTSSVTKRITRTSGLQDELWSL